ncbi:unnamed protein product [Phytophthora fragariaefolia]|uniref:Unnamed protein product n=1 Tax=Phytophthora fragariaefolia TaxID=1490495 RepID=A0A9W6TL73_9STRA|nr:unnamed protein product [Phytophthora fragariaefolia]
MNRTIMKKARAKPKLEHLRVFGSHGYVHVDKATRTKLEPKCYRYMFIGYAENVKGYRIFDLDAFKVKVVLSVNLDEREVDGIYEIQPARSGNVIHVNGDTHDTVMPDTEGRQPTMEELIKGVENDAPDVNMERVEPEDNPVQPLLLEERPADVSSTRCRRLRSPCHALADEQGVGCMDADSLTIRALARTRCSRRSSDKRLTPRKMSSDRGLRSSICD